MFKKLVVGAAVLMTLSLGCFNRKAKPIYPGPGTTKPEQPVCGPHESWDECRERNKRCHRRYARCW